MLTSEQLARRAAREKQAGAVVVRAERVSASGDLVCSPEEAAVAARAGRVVAVMEHVDAQGRPRLVRSCGDAATLRSVVKRVVTDMCVVDITAEGPVVREVAPGVSALEVQEKSEPALLAGPDLTVVEA